MQPDGAALDQIHVTRQSLPDNSIPASGCDSIGWGTVSSCVPVAHSWGAGAGHSYHTWHTSWGPG